MRAPARDRLQFVERATGVPETSTRELGYGGTARSDDRHEWERDLVPHASRGVLIDGGPSERAEIHALPRGDHRLRPPH